MTDERLDRLIHSWKSDLKHKGHLMDVTSRSLIELTIKYLEELQQIKEAKG